MMRTDQSFRMVAIIPQWKLTASDSCIVAAIRLRGEPIQPSPKLNAMIVDSVQLARMVLAQIQR
jgi:hypothetical protein